MATQHPADPGRGPGRHGAPSDNIRDSINHLAEMLQRNFHLNVEAQVMLERASDREKARSLQVNQSLEALLGFTQQTQRIAEEATQRANAAANAAMNNVGGGERLPRVQKIDQKTFKTQFTFAKFFAHDPSRKGVI